MWLESINANTPRRQLVVGSKDPKAQTDDIVWGYVPRPTWNFNLWSSACSEGSLYDSANSESRSSWRRITPAIWLIANGSPPRLRDMFSDICLDCSSFSSISCVSLLSRTAPSWSPKGSRSIPEEAAEKYDLAMGSRLVISTEPLPCNGQ